MKIFFSLIFCYFYSPVLFCTPLYESTIQVYKLEWVSSPTVYRYIFSLLIFSSLSICKFHINELRRDFFIFQGIFVATFFERSPIKYILVYAKIVIHIYLIISFISVSFFALFSLNFLAFLCMYSHIIIIVMYLF